MIDAFDWAGLAARRRISEEIARKPGRPSAEVRAREVAAGIRRLGHPTKADLIREMGVSQSAVEVWTRKAISMGIVVADTQRGGPTRYRVVENESIGEKA